MFNDGSFNRLAIYGRPKLEQETYQNRNKISDNEFRWVLTSKGVCQVVKNYQESHEVNIKGLRFTVSYFHLNYEFLIKPIFNPCQTEIGRYAIFSFKSCVAFYMF
jgi:hypothetical protein